jgi:hypothetical protein
MKNSHQHWIENGGSAKPNDYVLALKDTLK